MFLVSALLFPKLALGMSGFETGLAVMPLVKSGENNGSEGITGRIANTKKLLTCAAVVMSAFLLVTSVITTVMIPPALYQEGGRRTVAPWRSWLLGPGFGSLYDISTIAILWFAGASALTGLLALFPKYLPKYGMAPDWLKNQKPMVVFFTAVSLSCDVVIQGKRGCAGGCLRHGRVSPYVIGDTGGFPFRPQRQLFAAFILRSGVRTPHLHDYHEYLATS